MAGMGQMGYLVGYKVVYEIHRSGAQREKIVNFAPQKGGHRKVVNRKPSHLPSVANETLHRQSV